MPLSAGTLWGPYEILAPLGAGGMGEVYRARDTKLKRDVALKILPEAFARDPGRMARFQREAEVLASLNHPNIAAIYGVEERALVMELVEGETLAGPLPVETALDYARQMAAALEFAHEKGVVHRDLKPANVMVTPAGVVKVLDFGLAKAVEEERTGNPETSPTLTMRETQLGVILGTAAYMAPEQARGKTVDKRADIWAYGVVLWEMLTGKRLFEGETVSDTLAQVLTKEPDWERVPVRARRLLRACLQKDPKQRLQAIGDSKLLLEEGGADSPAQAGSLAGSLPHWLAALAVAAAIGLGYVAYRHFTEEKRVLKMSVLPPEKAVFNLPSLPAVSPDGRRLAFTASVNGKIELWVRDLDALAARALTGTSDAGYPFWSPDSRWIGFFAGGKLKKIEAAGGPALTLCDAPVGRGASWSKDDIIVFAPNRTGGLFRVPAAGGSAAPVTTLDQALPEINHRHPWFLPDGRHFLYTGTSQPIERSAIWLGDLNSKTRRQIVTANSNAVYVPPGYLLFLRGRTLMSQPFDARKDVFTGEAVPVAESVDTAGGLSQGQFSASQNGVLAYTSGGVTTAANVQLTWFDRTGNLAGTVSAPGVLGRPAISPDGSTVVFNRLDEQSGLYDLWLRDLARGTESRFTFLSLNNRFPVWAPDGSHIAFHSDRSGPFDIYQKAVNGTTKDEVLDKDLRQKWPDDWSRDGRYLIEEKNDPQTHSDIWVLPTSPVAAGGAGKAFPYLHSEFNERFARLSPNGQWLAYVSDETRRDEVYVVTFTGAPSGPGGKWQVSTNGGSYPIWSRDGKELFFIGADQKMMAVEVKSSGTQNSAAKFEAGVPKTLFEVRIALAGVNPNTVGFDVAKDGRFLIPSVTEQTAASAPLTVVINWTAGLKK